MTVLVKILLTPALIAAVTLLARRWGPAIGGTIAGLPLTSAPVSVFLLVEQGPVFAVAAAGGTLLGLLSQGALCLAYAWAARRMRWPSGCSPTAPRGPGPPRACCAGWCSGRWLTRRCSR